MFQCYFCKQITPPKTKKHKIVIATREKNYPTRRRESKKPRGRFRFREDSVQDPGGRGVEIAEEVAACPACAAKQHETKMIPATPPPTAEVPATETAAESPAADAPTTEAAAPAAVAETPAEAPAAETPAAEEAAPEKAE